MREELYLNIKLRDVMDLVVAWEDVNGVEYNPSAKQLCATKVQTAPVANVEVKKVETECEEVHSKLEHLEGQDCRKI